MVSIALINPLIHISFAQNHQMGQHFQRVLVPEGVDHVRWELRVNHSRPLGQGTALWIVRKLQQEQMG